MQFTVEGAPLESKNTH